MHIFQNVRFWIAKQRNIVKCIFLLWGHPPDKCIFSKMLGFGRPNKEICKKYAFYSVKCIFLLWGHSTKKCIFSKMLGFGLPNKEICKKYAFYTVKCIFLLWGHSPKNAYQKCIFFGAFFWTAQKCIFFESSQWLLRS